MNYEMKSSEGNTSMASQSECLLDSLSRIPEGNPTMNESIALSSRHCDAVHSLLIAPVGSASEACNLEPPVVVMRLSKENLGFEGFSEPRSGIENPRSSIDVTDRRSVISTEDEGFSMEKLFSDTKSSINIYIYIRIF